MKRHYSVTVLYSYREQFYKVNNKINTRLNVLLWYYNKSKREVCEKYNRLDAE
jgi:hypothetical protein